METSRNVFWYTPLSESGNHIPPGVTSLASQDWSSTLNQIRVFDRGTTSSMHNWDTNPQTSWVVRCPATSSLTHPASLHCSLPCRTGKDLREGGAVHMLKHLQPLLWLSHWRIMCNSNSHESHKCHLVPDKCRKLSKVIFRILHLAALTWCPVGNT